MTDCATVYIFIFLSHHWTISTTIRNTFAAISSLTHFTKQVFRIFFNHQISLNFYFLHRQRIFFRYFLRFFSICYDRDFIFITPCVAQIQVQGGFNSLSANREH